MGVPASPGITDDPINLILSFRNKMGLKSFVFHQLLKKINKTSYDRNSAQTTIEFRLS